MENNEMNFDDFATNLTEVRKNLFALNLEIRELRKKIGNVDGFVTKWQSENICALLDKVHSKPTDAVESDSDGDEQGDLLLALSNKDKMDD